MKKLALLFLTLALTVSAVSCAPVIVENKEDNSAETTEVTSTEEITTDTEEESVPEETEPAATEAPEEIPADIDTSEWILPDVYSMNAVERNDDFELQITRKELAAGLYDGDFVIGDKDGIVVELKNNTANTINELKLLLLATGEDGKGELINGGLIDLGMDGYEYVQILGSTEADLAPGMSAEYSVKCSLNGIKTINAIAYSYIDTNGNEVINENAEEWLEYAVQYEIKN